MNSPTVITFGETLWDLLPTGKQPGGAPMNVAYHLKVLGLQVGLISKVGDDSMGEELKDFLRMKGVPPTFLQTGSSFPTGIVTVTLDDQGHPAYDIVHPVAWDYIEFSMEAAQAVRQADAFIFGSLASRTEQSCHTLFQLLKEAKLKVLDVNLRPPFVDQSLIEQFLLKADIVKMSDEEVEFICSWYDHPCGEHEQMKFLKDKFSIDLLVVTKGAEGAVALDEHTIQYQLGIPVKVQDTIGSGDAFLAGFLFKYLSQHPLSECLEFAGRLGAFVATQKGATPDYSITDLKKKL